MSLGRGGAAGAGLGAPCAPPGSAHPESAISISAQSAARGMVAFMKPISRANFKNARIMADDGCRYGKKTKIKRGRRLLSK